MLRTTRLFLGVLLAIVAQATAQEPLFNVAVLVSPTNEPAGLNIALAAAGGRLSVKPSESNTTDWAANNLINGQPTSWKSKDFVGPQSLTLAFHKGRTATVSRVIIDTRLNDAGTDALRDLPKQVDLFAALENKPAAFKLVTNAFLRRVAGRHSITFPPVPAKYLRVAFTTNYGGASYQASEVEVYEANPDESIAHDLVVNLAQPNAGGAVVRFTSLQTNIHQLFDGSVTNSGWMTLDHKVPTEIVLAFRGERQALVDRVVLNPGSRRPKESWPKRISIAVSKEHPLDGFEELGIFAIDQEARDHEFTLNTPARFLKLRILENYGGTNVSLGELKVIEGKGPEYRSLLLPPSRAIASGSSGQAKQPAAALSEGTPEAEPNDRVAQSVSLSSGKTLRGAIRPRTDEDFYSLTVPGPGAEVMTLELDGRPNVRTSVALLDETGKELRRYDPTRPPTQKARLSWRVEPGRYFVRVYEPPSSIVLAWDASSSMRGREQKLKQAIEAYISRVKPSERLQLVQFSRNTKALLPDFTSDPEKLRSALAKQFQLSSGTSFFDAMTNAMALLENVEGNRAIIVMSDGSDSSSRLSYPEFWKKLEEKRIRVYAIGLGGNLNQISPRLGTAPRRMLKHISMATDGWEFFTEDPEELGEIYDIVAEDLRSETTYAFTPTFGLGRGTLLVSAGTIDKIPPATSAIELIFDSSGSMRERIDGRRKIEIAKEVMLQTIDGIPSERKVALRLFGHRIQSQKPEARYDSELVVPPQQLDRALLKERINRLQPMGTTPIAYSLSQVTNDLANFSGDRAVVLVTDGREEAGGDPEGVLAQLRRQGFDLRLIIVGFGLKADVREDVRRIAESYGGRYFDANTTTELRQAVQHAVLELPMHVPFRIVESSGISLGDGTTGKGDLKVPAGVYTVEIDVPGQRVTVPNVRINTGVETKVFVRQEGGQYTVQVQNGEEPRR
jgi:Mg-chelatase subunit ChlD